MELPRTNDIQATVWVEPRMSVDPDAELVARIAGGDQAAARDLMNRHLSKLFNLARRMLGSKEEAEDVTQETFLRAWRHAARWESGAARFETWLHRVTMNLCYDRLRSRRIRLVSSDTPGVSEIGDRSDGPAKQVYKAQLATAVQEALKGLPDRQREAIVCAHYVGLSNIETAARMEISVEAVESLLARGRRSLKELLLKERDGFEGSVDGEVG